MSRPGLGARTLVAVVALGAFAIPATARPLAEYRSSIAEALVVLDDAYAQTSEHQAASLDRLPELLPARDTIEIGDDSISVDNGWIAAEMGAYDAAEDDEEREQIVERIAARIDEIQMHVEALETAPAHATADERAKLEEILSRPEFQGPAESGLGRYLRDLKRRVQEFLFELGKKLFGGSRGEAFSTGIRIVVGGLGLLGLVLLIRAIAIALARRGRGGKREKVGKTKKTKVVLGEEIDESTTSGDIAAAARALAAEGDHRGAIRKLFVALIFRLDEQGHVRLRAEATNREYLDLVREIGRLHPVMASMTDVFERVWYGATDVDRAGYEAFESMYTRATEIVAETATVRL